MKTICLLLLSASLIALTSCDDPEGNNEDPNILAFVGETHITVADFERELERRRSAGRPFDGKNDLLEEMVEREVLLQSPLKAGINKDPEVQRAYDNLLMGKLKERELIPRLKALAVSSEETRAAYDLQRENFTSPLLRRLSIIHVKTSPGRSEHKARQMHARIEAAREMAIPDAKGFAAAAVKYSDDQASRYRGGDLGWTVAGKAHARIPQEVLAAGHELESDGRVSPVVETGHGFYMVKRVATRPSAVTPIARVSKRLESAILRDKREQMDTDYKKAKASALSVRLFPNRLAKIEAGLHDSRESVR